MNRAIAISCGREEEAHARVLSALLSEWLGPDDIFLYTVNPQPDEDLLTSLRREFEDCTLAVAIIGKSYQRGSAYCAWEEKSFTDRFERELVQSVAVRTIERVKCTGNIKEAMDLVRYRPRELPKKVDSSRAFNQLEEFAKELLRQLCRLRASEEPYVLRHNRIKTPELDHQCVERNLGRLLSIVQGRPSGNADELVDAADEGIRSSAHMLASLQQTQTAGRVAAELKGLSDLAAFDSGEFEPGQLFDLQSQAARLLLEFVRPPPPGEPDERTSYYDRSSGAWAAIRCTLLVRFRSYLLRHVGETFPELPLFMEPLTTLVLTESSSMRVSKSWPELRSSLQYWAMEAAQRLAQQVWVARDLKLPVGRHNGIEELRNFRLERQKCVRRVDIWGEFRS